MTPASQVDRQSTSTGTAAIGAAEHAFQVERLKRRPVRGPPLQVQPHPLGPGGIGVVRGQAAGHVVHLVAFGQHPFRRHRLS